ncbi:retrovirus-related pol polyprotein from transposon TNT 1-94 [Tanacetum coccineum]|uniref:Retrovirus-related pol polyprotein from transposon TNT 1-94 n=1 Tax=Tanacetum coccineum TaxID=301880 RepID=A0ABQ5DSE6_9ASTR
MAPSTSTIPNTHLLINPDNSVNDPLSINNSDHPGMVLTQTPFNGGNFLGRTRNIKMALGAKLKLGFIDGTCVKPAVTKLSDAFLFTQSAQELWKEIVERYGQSNGPLPYQLERELSHIYQGNLSIASYFSKLKRFLANLNGNKATNNRRKEFKSGGPNKIEFRKVCIGCNQEGHRVEQCFEKIGYLDWYKGKKGKKGIFSCFTSAFALLCHHGMDVRLDWISDTGASDHMSPHLHLFILIRDQGLDAHFYLNDFAFQDPSTNQIIAVGKGSKCLYICKPILDPTHLVTLVSKLIHISDCKHLNAMDFTCESCSLAKHHKLSFPKSTIVSSCAFELVHMDLWGPYKKSALNETQYFFTIVDDYIRATWTYLVHTKDQILTVLSQFLAYIISQNLIYGPYTEGLHSKAELNALEKNNTWELTSLPAGHKAISSKWVYKIKYKANGTIDKYKARLVIRGFDQQEGRDYKHTFSLVAKLVTMRVLIALATAKAGYNGASTGQVCKLRKFLYGLKQTSRQWNHEVSKFLQALGFTQSKNNYSLFVKKHQDKVLVYVDDILITRNCEAKISSTKMALDQKFTINDLGLAQYFLGIEICRTAQFVSAPTNLHMQARLHLLRYLKGSVGKGLFYPVKPHLHIIGFSNADWAACLMTRRSLTGYCIFLGHSLVSWKILWLSFLLEGFTCASQATNYFLL